MDTFRTMKEKWAETISQIFFAERINNPNDSCSIFWMLWYREDFKYITSNCLQTLPGRFYYIHFTHVEIKDQKLNVRLDLLDINVFVSFVWQRLCIWVSRNFTLQKLLMNRKQEKKIKIYGSQMGLQQDPLRLYRMQPECKTTVRLTHAFSGMFPCIYFTASELDGLGFVGPECIQLGVASSFFKKIYIKTNLSTK